MKQYQVIQHEIERFEIRYATALENESEKRLRDEIMKTMCEYFGYQPIVEFTKEQEIKREANGKFYASICLVDELECSAQKVKLLSGVMKIVSTPFFVLSH